MDADSSNTAAVIAAPEELAPTPAHPAKWRVLLEFAILIPLYLSPRWVDPSSPWVNVQATIPWGKEISITVSNLHYSAYGLGTYALLFLWLNRGLRAQSFSWPRNLKRALMLVLAVVILHKCLEHVASWISYEILGMARIKNELKTSFLDPRAWSFFALVMLPISALAEEILYRAYLIQRIEVLAAPWKHATALGVLVSSFLFSVGHWGYGMGGALSYFISGLVFAGFYLYTGRNVWFVTLMHYLGNLWVLLGVNLGWVK